MTEVIQLAPETPEAVSYQAITCEQRSLSLVQGTILILCWIAPSKGVSLTFKGSTYPDPYSDELKAQSFNVRLFCDTETKDPTFKSYDGSEFWLEWQTNAGCAMADPDPGSPQTPTPDPEDGGDEETSVGSGLGYFFLL